MVDKRKSLGGSSSKKKDLNRKRVIVEMHLPRGASEKKYIEQKRSFLTEVQFESDRYQKPTLLGHTDEATIISIKGTIPLDKLDRLKKIPGIVKVWSDPKIEPFVDCDHENAKGTLQGVAKVIGADCLWEAGIRGGGVVVGVCDDGVDKNMFPVVDGWSPSGEPQWGDPGDHGHMCANAVVGIAPDVQIADIGVLKGENVFGQTAIDGFDWAIDSFVRRGFPQILTNSWGMYQQSWAPDYATDPNHPLTRKVIEAVRAGIVVLFAAGNCGSECPSDRCENDTGPGNSIWGANGHQEVITVGAVNINSEWVGYSSEGPAALWPEKPDLCGITHFKGYYSEIDTGTSAATPICAGVAALLRSSFQFLDSRPMQYVFSQSARDIGSVGWDARFGHGVIGSVKALEKVFELFF